MYGKAISFNTELMYSSALRLPCTITLTVSHDPAPKHNTARYKPVSLYNTGFSKLLPSTSKYPNHAFMINHVKTLVHLKRHTTGVFANADAVAPKSNEHRDDVA